MVRFMVGLLAHANKSYEESLKDYKVSSSFKELLGLSRYKKSEEGLEPALIAAPLLVAGYKALSSEDKKILRDLIILKDNISI